KKLTAWLHDPAEKALVLLQDPSGHEGGTIKNLRAELKLDTPDDDVKTADRWSSAADRPQWPRNEADGRFAPWTQVRFADKPVLIHPLTGREFDLKSLGELDYQQVKAVSLEHFRSLIQLGHGDDRLTCLAFWRFGSELGRPGLDALWRVLPADTRVPDHSIWNHLDTVSAFAGAMEGNDGPALLSMSFGPVQGFIAQARSTSDLWSGSHLLSMLVWEAMRAIAEEIGPDAFLFPQLRGLAVVDAWLLGLAEAAGAKDAWRERFKGSDWLKKTTDENPLFAAALPNKFLALVPRSKAGELAEKACTAARNAARAWAIEAAKRVSGQDTGHWLDQIEKQLAGFPHVFWAAVEWPGTCAGNDLDKLVSSFHACVEQGTPDDFFGQPVWKVLSKNITLDGVKFFEPNPGILYPSIFSLSERMLATAKTARTFDQLEQTGFRCTLCGEREWLSGSAESLSIPPGDRREIATIWNGAAGKLGIKKGEHLCGVCALKRLWPAIFVDRVKDVAGLEGVHRYVVSTHAMALATTLEHLIDRADTEAQPFRDLQKAIPENIHSVALPRKLMRRIPSGSPLVREVIRTLPAAFDRISEDVSAFDDRTTSAYEHLSRLVKNVAGRSIEKYYALILMDGDFMGAWLAGNEDKYRLPYKACWHPQIKSAVERAAPKSDDLRAYLEALRPSSPGRHAAISQALNSFSSVLAPFIMEDLCKGKLLYAGGDDVLAMVSVDELLDAMIGLRLGYSGIEAEFPATAHRKALFLKNGFARLDTRLMQMMGEKATASIGAVVVHHQTPLTIALRSLREAEQTAKKAGRNAFCIRVLKRSGGEVSFTDRWWAETNATPTRATMCENSTFGVLQSLKSEFSINSDLSRRAAYAAAEWLKDLPVESDPTAASSREIAQALLAHQFQRHKGSPETAVKTVHAIWNSSSVPAEKRGESLIGLLSVAEFLARESRSGEILSEGSKK
ncbi:MAG TPA: type III-B CRISPR-associated protein Cas10/Cmr2, partial [Candidatus Ozemobacteraceae bacterium]|nr:type III-B CRISPR-associated protein Cas10/Cmr2 [Candidatus Ozemobacteraceae bacterium]